MGRTGTYHAWQQEGIVPDIQTVAKGLAGGYAAVSMVLMTPKIVDGLNNSSGFFNHGHTHGYHAVACAAALEVQNIIQRDNLIENVNAMGKRLGLGLQSALKDQLYVGDIRGRGLFWVAEFVYNKCSKEPFPPEARIASRIKQAEMKELYGISLFTGSGTVDGIVGDHALISPPYNIISEEVDEIVRLITRVIEDELNPELVANIKAGV
jgi:adenosylmethionine-8-amino-7-oxononanoate aminotransferase